MQYVCEFLKFSEFLLDETLKKFWPAASCFELSELELCVIERERVEIQIHTNKTHIENIYSDDVK